MGDDADDAALVSLEVPVVWAYVRRVRAAVREGLTGHPEGLRDAAEMVASELVENAVKYGESVPACPMVRVRLAIEGSLLTIAVSNGVSGPERAASLRQRIERLRGPDHEALYVERIHELLDDPREDGKLGLFRIGAEGGFRLEMHERDDVVTIFARRDLT